MKCVQGAWYGRYQRYEINENCTRAGNVWLCQHSFATKKKGITSESRTIKLQV